MKDVSMATYISRHNPRKQAVVHGMVRSPERYDRFYDITTECLQRGLLPVTRLEPDRLLFRSTDRDIEQSRTIAPAQYSSESLSVRYSGARLNAHGGQGALYLASLAGLLREQVHYGGAAGAKTGAAVLQPGRPDHTMVAVRAQLSGQAAAGAGAARRLHVYRLNTSLRIADVRVRALAGVFGVLLAAPGARAEFGFSPTTSADLLVQSVLDPQDYSAARGIADAIHDWGHGKGLSGLVATSARGDSDSGVILYSHGDGVEGYVYAFFGQPGQVLSALTPVASYNSFKDLTEAVRSMPGFQWIG